jgi:YgiT-type zinc finger domain-containing protein
MFSSRIIGLRKIMNSSDDICPLCGAKKMSGTTPFTADLGSGVVVVRQVRATVCSQCGEEWVDDATARQLEQIVNDARERRLQVEVAELR